MSTEFASDYFEVLMNANDIYFAGLFDGEGCITIDKTKNGGRSKGMTYRLNIQVAMVDRRPLDELQRLYGGGVYKASFGRLCLSQAYRWCIQSLAAEKFLYRIRPYVRVKPEEIDVALAYREHMKSGAGYFRRNADKNYACREKYRAELQALKRRFRVRQSQGEPPLTPTEPALRS